MTETALAVSSSTTLPARRLRAALKRLRIVGKLPRQCRHLTASTRRRSSNSKVELYSWRDAGIREVIRVIGAGGVKSDTCILSFLLRGKAAKLLFDGMRAKAVQEEACTGGMVKAGGNGL
jgi:hypothetical protein